MANCNDDLLAKLELETYRAVGTDDKTGGEGAWAFYLDPNGTDRVAVPPDGTWGSTLTDVAPRVIAAMGGGHVAYVLVDPSDPKGPRRNGIVVAGPWVDPAGAEASAAPGQPADAQPTPKPVPTSSPPPARGEGEQG